MMKIETTTQGTQKKSHVLVSRKNKDPATLTKAATRANRRWMMCRRI